MIENVIKLASGNKLYNDFSYDVIITCILSYIPPRGYINTPNVIRAMNRLDNTILKLITTGYIERDPISSKLIVGKMVYKNINDECSKLLINNLMKLEGLK